MEIVSPNIDYNSSNYSYEIFHSLRDNGYIILSNHPICLNNLPQIYFEWSNFFKDPSKVNYLRSEVTDEGYVGTSTEKHDGYLNADKKEFFQSHLSGLRPNFINFDSTKTLLEDVYILGCNILSSLEEKLPEKIKNRMTTGLVEMIKNSDKHSYRIVHYPQNESPSSIPSAGIHTNICLLTILPSPTDEGFEIKTVSGQWIKPVVEKNNLVIFNSDMIELATNNYFKSSQHRVEISENTNCTDRYSLPIFIHPRREVKLTPTLSVLDALRIRFSELGYRGDLFEG